MKKLFLATTMLGMGLSFQVHADSGVYLRGDLGISMIRDASGLNTNGNGSAGEVKYDFDNKAIWGFGAGYQFSELFRADVTFQHQNTVSSGPVLTNGANTGATNVAKGTASTYLANGYLELAPLMDMDGPFKPFVGAGIGLTTHDVDKAVSSSGVVVLGDTTNDFTWRLAAGTGYDLTEDISLNVEYAYMDMGEAKTSKTFLNSSFGNSRDTPHTEMRSHNLMMGIRYKF